MMWWWTQWRLWWVTSSVPDDSAAQPSDVTYAQIMTTNNYKGNCKNCISTVTEIYFLFNCLWYNLNYFCIRWSSEENKWCDLFPNWDEKLETPQRRYESPDIHFFSSKYHKRLTVVAQSISCSSAMQHHRKQKLQNK